MQKIKRYLKLEEKRQKSNINLIASENYIDKKILKIQASTLSNKYSEGYPGKRYYSGCKYIDNIENLAINYCKNLFEVKYVNVQPHSGSQANQAVYMAFCNKNDTILSLSLDHGGHLTHGHPSNFSYRLYKIVHYKTKKNNYIDYDNINNLCQKYKPKLIITGTSSYSRIINWKIIKNISVKYHSILLADISHISGLISAKLYPSPINIADVITSTLQKTMRGPRGGIIMTNNKLYINKINKAVFPGIQGGPAQNIIAAKAACFILAKKKKFIEYQKNVIKNAKYLVKYLKILTFNIVSNGTDSHLFIINLNKNKLTGTIAEKKLMKINITCNKNKIPEDSKSSYTTSGIRLGTAPISTRNIKKTDIKFLSKAIYTLLIKNTKKAYIKYKIKKICKKYPIYEKKYKK